MTPFGTSKHRTCTPAKFPSSLRLRLLFVIAAALPPDARASPATFVPAKPLARGYWARGVAYRGVAKVSVAQAYDSSTMALTAALAPADQWRGYATWLPQVADQLSASNGGAFGMRGIMQQNLQNLVAYAQAARQYREWSHRQHSRRRR